MATTSLPRYSSKLRETFHQINAYHISCTYKALFDDHALDILRRLSDVEDANNVCLPDPPTSCGSSNKSSDAGSSRFIPSLIDYGEDELGPCSGRFSFENERLSPGMCYKPDCQLLLTMFLRNSALKTSCDAHTLLKDQITGPWETCSLVETEECSAIHDVASATSSSPRVTSNGTINSARCPAILNPLPFSSPLSPRDSSPRTRRLQLAPQTRHSDSKIKSSEESPPKMTKTRSVHDYPRKEDISYPFPHGEFHLGHIKQYRENVTKVNLQQALMRCAYLNNPSHKDRLKMAATSIMMDCEMTRWRINNHGKVGSVKGNKCTLDPSKEKDTNHHIIIASPFEEIGDQPFPRSESQSTLDGNSSKLGKVIRSQTATPTRSKTKGGESEVELTPRKLIGKTKRCESDVELTPRKSVAKKKLPKVHSSTT